MLLATSEPHWRGDRETAAHPVANNIVTHPEGSFMFGMAAVEVYYE